MARFSFPGGSRRRQPMFGAGRGRSSFKLRLIMAAGMALFALVSYYGKATDLNQITGKSERVALTEEAEEVALGLQATPSITQQHGGVSSSAESRLHVQNVGSQLLVTLEKNLNKIGRHNPYYDDFRFTLLADRKTINAFALPGGQVFITEALYSQLETEGQLAGVLGHEIGHVIERHGNKRMAKEKFFQGLAGAAGSLGGDAASMQMAQKLKQVISMKYGRTAELESDRWGVKLMVMSGYDPTAMYGMMDILDRNSKGGPPEMMSTHPKPANRKAYIKKVIQLEFPNGLPRGLRP